MLKTGLICPSRDIQYKRQKEIEVAVIMFEEKTGTLLGVFTGKHVLVSRHRKCLLALDPIALCACFLNEQQHTKEMPGCYPQQLLLLERGQKGSQTCQTAQAKSGDIVINSFLFRGRSCLQRWVAEAVPDLGHLHLRGCLWVFH